MSFDDVGGSGDWCWGFGAGGVHGLPGLCERGVELAALGTKRCRACRLLLYVPRPSIQPHLDADTGTQPPTQHYLDRLAQLSLRGKRRSGGVAKRVYSRGALSAPVKQGINVNCSLETTGGRSKSRYLCTSPIIHLFHRCRWASTLTRGQGTSHNAPWSKETCAPQSPTTKSDSGF